MPFHSVDDWVLLRLAAHGIGTIKPPQGRGRAAERGRVRRGPQTTAAPLRPRHRPLTSFGIILLRILPRSFTEAHPPSPASQLSSRLELPFSQTTRCVFLFSSWLWTCFARKQHIRTGLPTLPGRTLHFFSHLRLLSQRFRAPALPR